MERRTFAQTILATIAGLFGLRSCGIPDPSPASLTLPTLEVQGADFQDGPWREVSEFTGKPKYFRVQVIANPPSDVHYGSEQHANGWYRIWATSRDGRYTGSAFVKHGRQLWGLQVEYDDGLPPSPYPLLKGARTNVCCGHSQQFNGATWT